MLAIATFFLVFLTIFFLGEIMATLTDVNDSLAAQGLAIAALAARIPAPGTPPAATEADLDGVKAQIDANTAAVNALAPTV